MEELYKGYKITYQEFNKMFVAHIGPESTYTNGVLAIVKKHIDHLDKQDFKRTQALIEIGYGRNTWEEVTITSEYTEGSHTYVWITNKHKTRSKHRIDEVYLVTPKNTAAISELEDINKAVIALRKKSDQIVYAMERYVPTLKIKKDQDGN